MSSADRCRVPLPTSNAMSSSSESDDAPRATRRSRGRVDSGHSRMGTHAEYRTPLDYADVMEERLQSTTAATRATPTRAIAAKVIACEPAPAQATTDKLELANPDSPSVSQTGRPRNGKPDAANRTAKPSTAGQIARSQFRSRLKIAIVISAVSAAPLRKTRLLGRGP